MSERETLALCPFCGGKPVMRTVLEHPGEWFVEWLICCHDCGIRMGAEHFEDVVDAWNRRHAPAPQPEAGWRDLPGVMPPLHTQVLVELRDGVGQVCDVACYIGEDRWILTDVRLDSRQIVRWASIYPQPPQPALATEAPDDRT